MILSLAVAAGYLAGLARARIAQTSWQAPILQHLWLVPIFFLPQFFAFYLPATRDQLSTPLVAACLISSQAGLLLFCLLNWQQPGMPVLAIGLSLNLIAILANGGLMPISTHTVARLVPASTLANLEVGSRVGVSKDILLEPAQIVFPWLADRFTPSDWVSYRFAFSLGDIFIGIGAFALLAFPPKTGAASHER